MTKNIEHLLYMLEMAYKQDSNLRLTPIQCKELLDDLAGYIASNMNSETKSTPKKESKKKYGKYKHVRLTDKEFDSIVECYGQEKGQELINYLDEYIEMKGYKAKNHYLCIKKWVVEAVNQNKHKPTVNPNSLPEWFNQEVKQKKTTEEERAEMEELLKEYRQEEIW